MFTQAQLREAYDQMRQERAQEAENAHKAAEWVKNQLALGQVHCHDPHRNTSGFNSPISPEPVGYVIVCVHETYGPLMQDYLHKLGAMPWATPNSDWVYGYGKDAKFYDVQTPFGDYKLTFEYFDNHCTGY